MHSDIVFVQAKEKPIETLTELIDEMRFGQSPIVVKNRKYRLRRYKNTFVGACRAIVCGGRTMGATMRTERCVPNDVLQDGKQ